MAFIKRSTTIVVNAKVGKNMFECLSCGKPFVSKISANLCQSCILKITPNKGGVSEGDTSEIIANSDLDLD